jgi:hypothetical protein
MNIRSLQKRSREIRKESAVAYHSLIEAIIAKIGENNFASLKFEELLKITGLILKILPELLDASERQLEKITSGEEKSSSGLEELIRSDSESLDMAMELLKRISKSE